MSAEELLLLEADKQDGYASACLASPINSAARAYCQYIPWSDQSLAAVAQKSLPPSVKVIILAPSADGGMPHTRAPNIICLPAYFPEEHLAVTLRHEMIHISQRTNPEEWRRRALKEGWSEAGLEDVPAEHAARCRLNPDTYDSRFWAWEGRYIPLPLFVREDKPNLRDISVRWWDRQEERLLAHAPTSFIRRYGNLGASSAEHPYELWAYRLE
jgi:hypothetical protein